MDTETVLKIIEMINHDIAYINGTTEVTDPEKALFQYGGVIALAGFRDHLQSYIESQVNQVENEMNRGE